MPDFVSCNGSRLKEFHFLRRLFSSSNDLRECARLQGFPEKYILPEKNEKQVYKQIGNSVAVPVVYRIAKNIVEALQ